jgi:hypothetical protein
MISDQEENPVIMKADLVRIDHIEEEEEAEVASEVVSEEMTGVDSEEMTEVIKEEIPEEKIINDPENLIISVIKICLTNNFKHISK